MSRDRWERDPRRWSIEDYMRQAVVDLRGEGYQLHLITDHSVSEGDEAGVMMVMKPDPTLADGRLGFIAVADETELTAPPKGHMTYEDSADHSKVVAGEIRKLLRGAA